MKKLFLSVICSACLFASNYEQYELDKDFKQYFEKCDLFLNKYYYVNCYNYQYKGSVAVAYKLKKDNLQVHIKKRPKFESDFEIAKKYRTEWEDYLHTGYDRGHILSNQSMNATTNAQRSTFLMSNITPQVPEINRKLFLKAERYERMIAIEKEELDVLNLIIYDDDNLKYISNKRIAIPSAYIKIFKTKDFLKCFYIPNNKQYENYKLKQLEIDCSPFFE